MTPSITTSSASTYSMDLNGDGIRSEQDANYRRNMLANITRGYENGWLK